MRLLYVINGFDPGGAEHGLLALIEGGFFEGHDLVVFGFCRGRGSLAEEIRRAVGPNKFRIAYDAPDLSLHAVIKGTAALLDELVRRRPDALVLSLKQANVIGRAILMLFPRVRCISFEHSTVYRSRRYQSIYRLCLWLLSVRVGEVWADCRQTLNVTSKYFAPCRRRSKNVVPLFCSSETVEAKTTYLCNREIRLCAAGRLIHEKNFHDLIQAVGLLRKAGVEACLEIYGDGPEYDELQRLIVELDLADRVSLVGYRASWFESAATYDMFVNASVREGFCIVVAEAMMVGLPVITTDVGGVRDYGVDGANMVKIGSSGPAELAGQIGRLAQDDDLREAIGRRAAIDIRRDYGAASLRQCGRKVLAR